MKREFFTYRLSIKAKKNPCRYEQQGGLKMMLDSIHPP
jgi:hypothetical protein